MTPVHRARSALLALAAAAATTLAGCRGCSRDIHFAPAGSDSASVHSADSLRAMMRHAQELWETPEGGVEAARTTATILREDIQTHPDQPWASRARALLDSLDFGAELAADRRVLAINLFSRSRPDAGASRSPPCPTRAAIPRPGARSRCCSRAAAPPAGSRW